MSSTMDTNTAAPTETDRSSISPGHLLFSREVGPFFFLLLESFILKETLISHISQFYLGYTT